MLFLLKIAVPPVLVALMSLAARWWGPAVGGLLMGLPWMTGPVLFFLALDKGNAFGADACTGIQLGVLSISAFVLVYGYVSAVAGWAVCLLLASLAFAALGALVQSLDVTLWQAALLASASLFASLLVLPAPRAPFVPAALPWWDIPARMLATLALVSVIMLSADVLGPTVSGIVSTFPAVLTVVAAFTHHQWGRDAALRVVRGLTVSLQAFIVFFLVLGMALPHTGLAVAFASACAGAIPVHAGLMALARRRAR